MPRFDQSFSGICEQNLQDTMQLKQRYLDAKAKRVPKSKDKKNQESIQSSVHVQQKFLKRSAEELDPGGPSESFEPPVKLQCTTQQHGTHQNEGLTKFSVEIVQQLEFTTSAASSQPQQISTNVTVKTHANASVKSDVSSPKSNASPAHQKANIGLDVGTLVECVKQEPDNDFADLDQCAAALEKDAAANGGTGFGGFPDLIGDDTNDEIISSATFNDLISDISNYPDYELMKDFDFDDKSENSSNNLKLEDIKDLSQNPNLSDNLSIKNTHSPIIQNQNYSPPVFDKSRMTGYPNMDFSKTELSPAAQTLKQMAEQHQHKSQMGLSFTPNARTPNPRSPYPDFQFQGDYGSPNSNPSFHKNSPSFPQPDMIKQEMIFQGNDFDMKRKSGIYKQQYSPYNSPSASSHGSPGFLPRSGTGPNPSSGPFRGGTPPRPPSGPGGNNSGASVQINQAQQLNISQQSHGHTIQVSAGQQVHLTGDLKGNVSIAAQQGMHFSQHSSPNGSTPTQPNSNTNQQHQQQHQHSQHSPMSSSQHQNSPMNNMGSQSSMNHQSSSQIGSDMLSGNQQMPSSQQHSVGPSMQGMGGLSSSGNMPGPDNISGNMSGLGNLGMPSNNMGHNSGMGGLNSNLGGSGSLPSSMGGMHPGMHHVGGMGSGHSDTYSLSQTQTINFTQQSLQRTNGPGVPNRMGPTGPLGPGSMTNQTNMGPRLLNAQQSLEQQKLLHQQQMMRAQQAAMQQHIVRPPPPDYKASAGMMQGMQPRYATTPQNIRRMPHQPIPPSGPMMRSNMFMLPQQQQQQQQQQIPQRTVMYSRQQQGPLPGIEQHNPSEWRHLLMTQQQNSSFNSMRPNFQQGFNMNSGSIQQLTALQHQQIRTQQGMVSSGLTSNQQNMNQGMGQGQVVTQGGNPMTQINNMNQAMLHMQQQQQQSLMQQHNPHMSMSNIHMQQSQSITVTNHQQGNMNNQLSNTSSTNQSNALSNFNPQADFSLEFLENLAASDTGTFTDQDLLNSFDSDAGFNLDF